MHSRKWPRILDLPYKIFLVGVLSMRKTDALINFINEESYIGKIYTKKGSMNPIISSQLKHAKVLVKATLIRIY